MLQNALRGPSLQLTKGKTQFFHSTKLNKCPNEAYLFLKIFISLVLDCLDVRNLLDFLFPVKEINSRDDALNAYQIKSVRYILCAVSTF
jgi:hypothetical protein